MPPSISLVSTSKAWHIAMPLGREASTPSLDGNLTRKSHSNIILDNHDFGLLDSFAKSTSPNPPRQIQPSKHPQNSGLIRDKEAFAPRQTGTSLVRWLRRHVSCAHRLLRAPGHIGIVRARWRWAGKEMPRVVAEKRSDPCDGFDAACALSNNTDLIGQIRL